MVGWLVDMDGGVGERSLSKKNEDRVGQEDKRKRGRGDTKGGSICSRNEWWANGEGLLTGAGKGRGED